MRRMPLLQLVTAILALRRAAAVQKQKQLLSPLFDERLAGARRNKGSRLSAAPSLSGFRPSSTKSPIANMQEAEHVRHLLTQLEGMGFSKDLAEQAVAGTQFVQESAPERLEIKQPLYARLGVLVPDDIIIASSTSGLLMTDIQADCPTPGRTIASTTTQVRDLWTSLRNS